MSIVSPRSLFAPFAAAAALVALPALLSCQQLNPRFCAGHPEDADCTRIAVDGGGCVSNAQCPQLTPVCEIGRSMCVQCAAGRTAACTGATPVCGVDDTCRSCALDTECASLTCLPDGSCASPLDVLHVSPTGTDVATCMPDDHCSLGRALALIDGTKSTIRLDPERYQLPATLVLPDDLRLVGRGAVITRGGGAAGPTLIIPGSTHIAIDYLTIEGGTGSDGHGISCANAQLTMRDVTIRGNAGVGIAASNCALVISHSRIADNQDIGVLVSTGSLALTRSEVAHNRAGGLSLFRPAFDLENNVIIGNGSSASAIGGAMIVSVVAPGDHVFAFNTIARNQAIPGMTGGVFCAAVAVPVAMTSSIVYDNATAAQVEGAGCNWAYSDIGPVSAPGTGNITAAPQFLDPVHDNFHLQGSSPARDAADPAATLAIDVDGDARPQGARRDMGADEIK